MKKALTIFSIFALILTHSQVSAQYFGQNKVRYKSFDYRVLETEHFAIHYYDEEREAVEVAARMAERWHLRLTRVFGNELPPQQPIILYDSHPSFRQTSAIPGHIGESTGGVTEALKRRVVLPFAGPLAETDHVLGHELVHAFQYYITGETFSMAAFRAPGVTRLPLWFVEGMAEYLSLGPTAPITDMWIRDAALREELPGIKELNQPRYFPYRWGHAFWTYVAGRWGDQVVGDLLKAAGKTGTVASVIPPILGVSVEELSEQWHAQIEEEYGTPLSDFPDSITQGERFISEAGEGGRLNVSPALSPDGTQVVFLSERDLF